jgi:hypothetical protein
MECSHANSVLLLVKAPPMPWRSTESEGQERRVSSVRIAAIQEE